MKTDFALLDGWTYSKDKSWQLLCCFINGDLLRTQTKLRACRFWPTFDSQTICLLHPCGPSNNCIIQATLKLLMMTTMMMRTNRQHCHWWWVQIVGESPFSLVTSHVWAEVHCWSEAMSVDAVLPPYLSYQCSHQPPHRCGRSSFQHAPVVDSAPLCPADSPTSTEVKTGVTAIVAK